MKRMLTIALLLLMTAVWPACGEKTGLQDLPLKSSSSTNI